MNKNRELIFSATKKDFRVDTFRSGGPGGQHQNKTESGVRITHMESGLSAECRTERSQKLNKKEAFRKLVKLLVAYYVQENKKERINSTKVVRTYNECKDRVIDHDSGKEYSFKNTVKRGRIEDIIEERRDWILFNQIEE